MPKLCYNASMKKFTAIALALFLMLSGMFAGAAVKTTIPDWAGSALNIPSGVVTVEANAFDGVGASDVVLPLSVRSVEANAFSGMDNIKRICVLNDSVTLGKNALGIKGADVEIWGHLGSNAEKYADDYELKFVRIYTYEESLMDYAASKLGTKYVNGSWDCVLYVRNCYLTVFGIKLPDTCRAMEKLSSSSLVSSQKLNVTRITDINALKTGDIICWKNDEVSYCTHVGMYVGAGKVGGVSYSKGVFIENSSGAGKVRYHRILANSPTDYYTRNFICAWRILP